MQAEDRQGWRSETLRAEAVEFKDYDTDQRKKMIDKKQAMPDGSFPIADCEDLRNAIQAIGRAKDPDAAKRHVRKRKAALGCPDVELPDTWAGEAEEFKRGPGWVTNPKETRRLHAYWTKPGHKGYAKIRWGTPGDFRRLRRALSKYIDPIYLNRVAAQWHFDALGYWPGECGRPGNPPCGAKRAHLGGEAVQLVAAATAPNPYPAEWFQDPRLDKYTPLTVEDSGRVYGHLAAWDVCHVGIDKVCKTAPHSADDYHWFHQSNQGVFTTDGWMKVGHITMETGHAGLWDSHHQAASHYDNTGTVVADVRAGEDEFGIWLAGAITSNVDEERLRMLRAASISGDWRNDELIAALVVNVPGFPTPKTAVAVSGGKRVALVAAGVVRQADWGDSISGIVDAVEEELARRANNRTRAAVAMAVFKEERLRRAMEALDTA